MSKKNYMQAQEELLDRINIVDLISDVVPLKRKGVNYNGSCPFHEEKTPSFMVSNSKGIYKCFGCGRAGNAVNFYIEHNKISWKEAIEELAKKYHVELKAGDDSLEQRTLQRHRQMLEVTAQFYHNKIGKIRDYVHSRGITDKSIEQYNLGFAEDNFSLKKHLNAMGFSVDDMLSQGLIIFRTMQDENEKNLLNYFERFSGRLMFPIYDERNRITGFSGRILPEFDKGRDAKYLNSPESDLYRKSTIFYGMNVIKDMIVKSKQVHLVEGYTDVILMNQNGILTVGKSGTSLSDIQARKLAKYVKNVIIIGDNDAEDVHAANPGLTAAKRDFSILLTQGISTRAIVLPPKEDPASYIQKHTKAEFEGLERLNLAGLHVKTSDTSDPDKKVEVLENIVQELSYIDDPLKKYLWIREVGKLLDIPDIFIARKYTVKLSEEIKDNSAIDYFSKAYINDLASKFVAKLLLTTPKFAMPYLRDVPLSDIPNDGSIFSKRMLELYTTLNGQFSMGDYQLSMFGMDMSKDFGAGIDANQWGLMDEHKQKDFRNRHLHYSIDNPELYRALSEVSKVPRMSRGSRRPKVSKEPNPIEPKPLENIFDLDTLARLLRSEIFLKKQNVLMSSISERLLSGQDISNLLDDVEKLHYRV